MNFNRLNFITLGDGIHDILSLGHFTEDGVFAIEVRSWAVGNEELGTVGIWSCVGHRKDAWLIVLKKWLALTLKLVARTTHAGTSGVTPLDHKVGDHAVEYDAIVEAITGEAEETSAGHLSISRKHANFNWAFVGLNGNVDVFDIAHVAVKKPWIHGFCTDFFKRSAFSKLPTAAATPTGVPTFFGTLRWSLITLGPFFIGLTAVISLVKARPFKNNARACAQKTLHLPVTPILWAIFKLGITHLLEDLKDVLACLAAVIVIWHQLIGLRWLAPPR